MDTALIWFRRDLRLHDNAALHHALHAARRVHAVFVFDRAILDTLPDRADRRVEFIWHSVAALREALRARGGELTVLHGDARTLIPAYAARLGAGAVFAARDYEPFAIARDQAIARQLTVDGRALHLLKDQVIFEPDELLTAAGKPYHVFTPYRRTWLARLGEADCAPFSAAPWQRLAPPSPHTAPGTDPFEAMIPRNLKDLGFLDGTLAGLAITPGEAGAQALLDDFRARIAHYRIRRDFPAMKGPSYLSVHLRFGTVSVRELVRFAHRHSGEGAQTWVSELIWREFYQMLLRHYPETVSHAFQHKFDKLAWPNPPGHFEAWCAARTGYPIVDAAMRQLDHSGYMHNRLRMITASFLVKDLHVDWRLGEAYFARKLIDYEQASNVGGWQWSAGIGTDAQPWFRVFNPVTQSEKFDPAGHFIRRYLPELAALPEQHLHAPWRMPSAARLACGFMPGRDYPLPIVDHAAARAATLALFKGATG